MLLISVSERLPFCVTQLVLFHLVLCFLEPINGAKWGMPVFVLWSVQVHPFESLYSSNVEQSVCI
jgi:hypothetical protein